MKKNILVVTGGAGFIGSNLIEKLLNETKFKIVSIDNYSAGFVSNHVINKRITYIKGNIKNITSILKNQKKNIKAVFHFGEFSRIAQSFEKNSKVFETNIVGTYEVIKFCFINKIKIIYSATSASFGNNFNDQHLSPYAFSKTKNLELILNLNKWFSFKYEIIYFYNAYGTNQIINHKMAAVIGIFETCKKNNTPLPIVKPGYQKRNFTHVDDIIKGCIYAFKKDKNQQYTISNNKSYSILKIAKMFKHKYKFINSQKGERFKSSLPKKVHGQTIKHIKANIDIRDYIKKAIKN